MPTRYRRSAKDDDAEPAPEAADKLGVTPGEGDDDAEGHMFLPNDPATARSLAQGRSVEIDRQVRERQRQKEARPNRR